VRFVANPLFTSLLPIDTALPELRAALLDHRNVVLQAPPGAGKSTRVPLALLDESWLGDRKIVMLEPRRLATRAVASRMSHSLGEAVGKSVGYRTRLETRVSGATRIEVVTEGILTRWLQRDAALEDVALVIFDEFHERSLQADLGLALTLDAQATLRDDLRILVMSATLDGQAVAKLLGDARIVTSAGRAYPVETRYREPIGRTRSATPERPLPDIVAGTVANAIDSELGDALVFLPGQGEIHRTQRLLEERSLPRGTRVLPLYGELAIEQQDEAIKPSVAGQRKVVLATNIAETSLTIEGVRIVVDSGLERRMRFDPATGMGRLETGRISRASADQRRGRAGRLEAGVCYRLWSEAEHSSLLAQTPAEILEADLAPLALELAAWGIVDPSRLQWLDPPPSATFAQARDLLLALEAIDGDGRITTHGRALTKLGTHPRLAHMIMRAAERGLTQLALEIAALLGERDLLRSTEGRAGTRDIDLRLRVEALHDRRNLPRELAIDTGARQRVMRTVDQLARQLTGGPRDRINAIDIDRDTGVLLALAYPDRIAMSRGSGGRYLLSSGRGALLIGTHSLAQEEFLIVADLDAGEREATIRLAAPLTRGALEDLFRGAIETRERIEWDGRENAVIARRERWLQALKLSEQRLEQPDAARVSEAMLVGVRELGIAQLPWTKEARALQARIEFARRVDPNAVSSWPSVSNEVLLADLSGWLAPWLEGVTRREHLNQLDMHGALQGLLNWNQQQRLDEIVPTHLVVPTGSRIPIDYSGATPAVSVRLQELFGLRETPTIGAGRVPLTLNLLSPAHRPVQVTQDLMSFWSRGYPDVKKELKGRYPKHYWPDDPLTAAPTARAKPRR
jgi:ATP-dependent helicase HrpB